MYKVITFAVKKDKQGKPLIPDNFYFFCLEANFIFIDDYCIINAIISDKINVDELQKQIELVEYDNTKNNTKMIEYKCDMLNGKVCDIYVG